MSVAVREAPHILIVDDESAVCESLALGLRQAGLDVVAATTAADALAAARARRPELLVVDLLLGDANGLEVIDGLRRDWPDLPAVIITGRGDAASLSEASRRRPVEVLTKPVDLARLQHAVQAELRRQEKLRHVRLRNERLRRLTRRMNRQRKHAHRVLSGTCADLTSAYRKLQGEVDRRDALIDYQTDLLTCANEDDVFRRLFALFVQRSGPVFGAAMLCDEDADLQLVGRFGVPVPDGVNFCRTLAGALVPLMLERPEVKALDALDNAHLFPANFHRMLVGLTLLAVPLMAGEGEIIGLVVLYRKGEQPFTEDDVALAVMIAPPTAAAAQKV